MTRTRKAIAAGVLALSLGAAPASACKLALALAVDVSGSIDASEYEFQMQGMADALEDPVIAEALVQAQAALSVIQWSGAGEQEASLPWQRMLTYDAVLTFAARIRGLKRRWGDSKTAVGDAVAFSVASFAMVPDCIRKVIDVSGDGITNAGSDTSAARARARTRGININGLAIDRLGRSVTTFFRQSLITGEGSFVLTASGYRDYPRAIRLKLFNEIVRPSS